jgi:hypothetical protein
MTTQPFLLHSIARRSWSQRSRNTRPSCSAVRMNTVYRLPCATAILTIGFLLIVSIYIQVAMLFGVYTPELFPTDVRLRANGIAATIVSPFIVL